MSNNSHSRNFPIKKKNVYTFSPWSHENIWTFQRREWPFDSGSPSRHRRLVINLLRQNHLPFPPTPIMFHWKERARERGDWGAKRNDGVRCERECSQDLCQVPRVPLTYRQRACHSSFFSSGNRSLSELIPLLQFF